MIIIFSIMLFSMTILFPIYHMINGLFAMKQYTRKKTPISERKRGISVLIPCYNEATIIETTIESMKKLTYKNVEFIFINDGSADHTLEKICESIQLKQVDKRYLLTKLEFKPIKAIYEGIQHANFILIDKLNGGKADALNAGIMLATHSIIVTLDADSILDNSALDRINDAFEDKEVIAAGGIVHVLQGRKWKNGTLFPTLKTKLIVKLQILEYFRGFFIYKSSLAKSNALSIISGAFGVFRKDVLLHVNGYRNTVGEDIDITIKVQNYLKQHPRSKILFLPDAACYTEVPESWRDLYKQRIRWQKAFTDCLVLYKKEFLTTIFTRKLSFFFLIDSFFIGIVCSYIFFTGVIWILFNLNTFDSRFILLYIILSSTCNLLYNFVALYVASKYNQIFPRVNIHSIALTIVLDLIFFRFLNILIICIGTVSYFIKREGWNKVARTGRDYSFEQGN
ncbi:glycosyltransferase family 2 protein [Bacillus alkalisoli]|uniref:glycosyltransferase family 2 protein n=1 Tax=Bacillus alkalisoli TaxID=2011008 RepID=UPI000C238FF6|nr:glycosyltransferase [Bacillus alkalisoli]